MEIGFIFWWFQSGTPKNFPEIGITPDEWDWGTQKSTSEGIIWSEDSKGYSIPSPAGECIHSFFNFSHILELKIGLGQTGFKALIWSVIRVPQAHWSSYHQKSPTTDDQWSESHHVDQVIGHPTKGLEIQLLAMISWSESTNSNQSPFLDSVSLKTR